MDMLTKVQQPLSQMKQTNESIYLANWWFCISRSRSLSALRSNPEKPLLVLLLWAMAGPTCWVAPGWLLSLDMDRKCSEEKWGGLTSCWLCILLGVWDLVGGADSIQCSELGVWASGCYNGKKIWKSYVKCFNEFFEKWNAHTALSIWHSLM